jgi:ribA/ribD-fused uncharacterized protein
MKVTDKHVCFWNEWPSNWHPAEFDIEVNGTMCHFHNTEQYFMYMKAIVFGDEEIAKQILADGDPKKVKALGRKVQNYDEQVWNEKRYQVMLKANVAKFSQNEDLKQLLLSKEYEGHGFVEASPYDKVWGVRMYESNPDIDDESKWKGLNLLGKVLDETRRIIREEDAIHENFSYWDNRDTDEYFFGISILIDDQGYTGKEMGFDSSNPDKMPTILLEDDYWQVESMRLFGKYDVELNLISNGNRNTVRIPEVDIEKKEAYKLLCAVFDNTEHEKDEGEDYEDVEDFYGWELS